MSNTVRFHRVLRAAPEKVYRAFLDADARAKWLPPNGFTGKVHHMDAKVGGTYKMSFTNFTTGRSHSFGGEYLELVPHERVRYTDRFDDPNLPGAMQTTIMLKRVSFGTELNIVQEGLPEVIPPDACYLGWQDSLTLLIKLVEAAIRLEWGRAEGSGSLPGVRSRGFAARGGCGCGSGAGGHGEGAAALPGHGRVAAMAGEADAAT
jgi:uncharacterized protein YndB with AHSA1/START domain